MATDKPRLSISMDEETFEKVKAFKKERGIATQSKAIIKIMEMGLEDLEKTVKNKEASSYSDEAMRVLADYKSLDHWGRQVVRSVIADEKARCEDKNRFFEEAAPPKEEPKVIPLFLSAPAAGIAAPIFGEDFDNYELTSEDPQGAMFAVKVGGDSMEPYFPDGSIAFCNKDPLRDGDIGVFSIDGGSVIKQYHYDHVLGMTYLFSLNRKRSDADVLITRSSGQTLTCLGRVITKHRYPIPGIGLWKNSPAAGGREK